MTNGEMAKKIAEAANACCHRSDGFEKSIYDLALPKQIPPAARVIASTTLIVLALLAFKWCTA